MKNVDYEYLVENAMRDIVRSSMRLIEYDATLLRNNYFLITFSTKSFGVLLPADMAAKYPEKMTVIIQNQFECLHVETDRFSVKLDFGCGMQWVVVPFKSVLQFTDPSCDFCLNFEQEESTTDNGGGAKVESDSNDSDSSDSENSEKLESAEIINFQNILSKNSRKVDCKKT